jgi:4'-phosphopantetheinyl transferase
MSVERERNADAFRELDERDVGVWVVNVDVTAEAQRRCDALLSQDERARAQRFLFDRDRRRFAVARGALRVLLGYCLHVPGDEIRFGYSPTGKPQLTGVGDGQGVHFNVSHSGDLALIALCAREEPGVDVELVRELRDMERIVRRFFCPEEVEQWLELPDDLRTRAFFDCWTRKEAYVKALGAGLQLSLDAFQVFFRPGETPGINVRDDGGERPWSIFDVSPSERYAGALAIRGGEWQVHSWPFVW